MIGNMLQSPPIDTAFQTWLLQLLPTQAELALLSPDPDPLQRLLKEQRPNLHLREPGPGLDWLLVEAHLESQPDLEVCFNTWKNWLQPTGRLVLSVPNLRYLPRLLTLLQGRWPFGWDQPVLQALTSEWLLQLLSDGGWDLLELASQNHELLQQSAIRAALASTGWDLSGFDADSQVSQWYLLATPRSHWQAAPLPLEGLRAHNLLLALDGQGQHWQALEDYLRQFQPQDSVACVLFPLEPAFDPEVWRERLLDWLVTKGFDPEAIPDLILPEAPLTAAEIPRLLATIDTLIGENAPAPWLEWARRLNKNLLWLGPGSLPTGFDTSHCLRDWSALCL
jgi:hypothetical protein